MMYRLAALLSLLLALIPAPLSGQCGGPWKVLHYVETTGYDHNTRSQSLTMFNSWASTYGYTVVNDNTGAEFNSLANLQQYAVVVFSNTSGNKGLDATQRANFEAYIQAGGSYLGIHAATDTYRHSSANGGSKGTWDWYAENVAGASVQQTPNHTNQNHNNTMTKQVPLHPTLANVPNPWNKTEEYYYWQNGYLNTTFTELLRVGQTGSNSYDAPRRMAHCKDLIWGGRAFYTALGHANSNFSTDVNFRNLIRDAMLWCAAPNISSGGTGSSMTLSAVITPDTCGSLKGAINLSVSGGTSPLSFNWSNGPGTEDISNLAAGSYSVTVTDNNGCTKNGTFIVPAATNSLNATISVSTPITCPNGTNGVLLAAASGGKSPYQFAWTNGPSTASYPNRPAGSYTVTVTDAQGCQDQANITLNDPADWNLSIQVSQTISCFGGTNGQLTATVSGANGGYSFLWSNGATGATASGLGQGSYSLVVTDNKGCTTNGNASLSQPSQLAISFTSTNVSCTGSSNGTLSATVSGGTGPYTFLWSNGATTGSINGLAAGNYAVTVTDSKGCQSTANATISAPALLVANVTLAQAILCEGATNGSLLGSASGGTSPYSYLWSNGATSNPVINLGTGSYLLTVTDANGCSDTASFVMTAPQGLVASVQITDSISCFGQATGGLSASVLGGTPGYSFLWSNGGVGSSQTGLPAGSYTVTITDANGCSDSASVLLSEPAELSLSATVLFQPTCFGNSDGQALALVSGGTAPFSLTWSNGSTANFLSGVPAGSYEVAVLDANGCTDTASVLLSNPAPVVAGVQLVNDISCAGTATGSLLASATGGSGVFTFQWLDGPTGAARTGLAAGTYTVVASDAAGCSDTASFTLVDPQPFTVAISQVSPVSCFGQTDGSLVATVSGTTGPLTYTWNTGASTDSLLNIGAATYWVQVQNSLGCQATDTILVSAPAGIDAAATLLEDASCFGGADGSAVGSATGGTQPYSFSWSNSQTSDTLQNVAAGTYLLTATDAFGCQDTASVSVGQAAALGLSLVIADSVDCFGGSNGALQAQVSGGQSPLSYAWSNGGTGALQTGLPSGNYSVVATDAAGCVDSASFFLSQPSPIQVQIAIQDSISCFGASDGSLLAVATSGQGGFTYLWSNTTQGPLASGLAAGSYTVLTTDQAGCVDSASVVLSQPASLSASISLVSPVLCFGGNDGSLSVSANGGTSPYQFAWSNGSTTSTATNLPAGNHFVIVTDANGCEDSATFQLTEPVDVQTNISVVTPVGCTGGNDGSLLASATGGSGSFTFLWSNGQTTALATSLAAGNFQVVVTDQNGCQDSASLNLLAPNSITATVVVQSPVSCAGLANGSLLGSATGGTGLLSYSWSNGQTGPVASGLAAGSYLLTVSDSVGCTDTASFVLTEPAPLAGSISQTTPVSCAGGANGSLVATASGGTPGYGFLWSNGQSNATATGLSAGSYSVVVLDQQGCADTASFVLSQPVPLVASISLQNSLSCFGGNDGALSVSANGGTPPYQFAWSNGSITSTATNLPAGTHFVIVTDANGCEDSATFQLNEPVEVQASIALINPVACAGGSDGSLLASATGGSGSFGYLWSNGQTSALASNLAAGSVQVVVTDASGCQDSVSFNLIAPNGITANVSLQTPVNCFGGTNGSLLGSATGGSGPLSYVWSNGQTGPVASGLAAGSYLLTVSDSAGCTDTVNLLLAEPAPLVGSINQTSPVSCAGGANGSLVATASGGTPGYGFLWSNGQSNATATGLSAGSYSVVVLDQQGCADTASFVLSQPAPLVASISLQNSLSCFGGNDGALSVSANGGTPPYQIAWSNGATTATASNLLAGSYFVTLTDANGCTDSASFLLTEPSEIQTSISVISPVACAGGSDGSLLASATGGSGSFGYLWSNGQTSALVSNLAAGNFQVIVTDANGCQDSVSFNLIAPNGITASISLQTPINCFGGTNGSLLGSATGGSGPLSYVWSNGQTGPVATGLMAGSYSVVVSDSNGCADTASFFISQPAQLVGSISVQGDINCEGGNDGVLLGSATGGSPGYTFGWSNGATGLSASGLSAGFYQLFVTDSKGCQDTAGILLSDPTPLVAAISVVSGVSCQGLNDGSLLASATGGAGSYAFTWNQGSTSALLSGLAPGNFFVLATDANGCLDTAYATLATPPAFSLSLLGTDSVACFGGNDGSATVQATGGTGSVSYLWNNGQAGPTATGLAAGTYLVTATDGLGCQQQLSATIYQPASLSLSLSLLSPISCQGATDGSLQVTASGGVAPVSFVWSTGSISSQISGLAAGSYTVVATDAAGCVDSASTTLAAPAGLSASISLTQPISCAGGSNGAALVTVTGGTAPFSYAWSNGQTSLTANNLAAGNVSVLVTDANGCNATGNLTLSAPPLLSVAISQLSPVSCFGTSTGSLLAAASGGSGAVSFVWSNGTTTALRTNLPAGTFIVTATDANGCLAKDTAILSQPPSFTATASQIQPATCNAAGDGMAKVVVNGGTAPFSFLWSDGSVNDTLDKAVPGNYTVVITDANGCTALAAVNISNLLPWSAGLELLQAVSCFGGDDGELGVNILNGTSSEPFSYLWSNGQTSSSATNLPAGIISLTLTDASGCVQILSDTLEAPDSIQFNLISQTNASCFGSNDGSLLVAASGGTGSLSYSWSNGQSGVSATGLSAQPYLITITDSLGCTVVDSFAISEPDPLSINLFGTDLTCFGANDGDITADVQGGTSPYTYLWNTGATSAVLPGLSEGTYSVVVTDASGCSDSTSITLAQPDELMVNTALTQEVSCFGQNDGAVSVNAFGGFGGFTYSWSNGGSGTSLSGLPAGSYVVTAIDLNGCQAKDTVEVPQPADLIVTATVLSNSSCSGLANGSAVVTYSGGSASYSVLWSNGATTDTISGLVAGSYTVWVTDASGCVDSANVTISQPGSLLVNVLSKVNVSCFGGTNGSATAFASSGSGPVSYLWSNGQTSPAATGLGAGTYQVTATDGAGCTATASTTITQPAQLIATINLQAPVSCAGGSNGSLLAQVTGGNPPYNFFWNTGQSGPVLSSLQAGTYFVIATGSKGCLDTASFVLTAPAQVVVDVATQQAVTCFGGNNGSAMVVATGGNGGFTYLWSNGGTGPIQTGLSAGSYTVTATDANGCTGQTVVTIGQASQLLATATVLANSTCNGLATGQAIVNYSGGSGGYTVLWSNGATSDSISGLAAGAYSVIVTDQAGCSDTAFVTVTQPGNLALVVLANDSVSCFGGNDGTASVLASGGTAPYSYAWSNGQTGPSASGLAAGNFVVTATDAQGCTSQTTISISEPAQLLVSISTLGDISCFGGNDGSLSALASGGTAPYTFLWSNGGIASTQNSLSAGTCLVTVTDASGCPDTASAVLTEPDSVLVQVVSGTDVSCFGGNDGSAVVAATGGNGGFSYLWSNGGTGPVQTGLSAGSYTVTATDANGCTAQTNVTVGQPTQLLATATVLANSTCNGLATGQAMVNYGGGSGGYTVLWSNGATSDSLSGLAAGAYSVIVTDQAGCSDTAFVTITQPGNLALAVLANDSVSCFGGNDGSASVLASGGTAPYSYAWSNVQTGPSASGLAVGTVDVTVTDAQGCTAQTSVVISQPAQLLTSISPLSNISCFGGGDGSLSALASGGTAPYTFLWSNGGTGSTQSSLSAGSHLVTVTDASGCIDTASAVLMEPDPVVVQVLNVADVSCFGGNDGQAAATAAGGQAPYSFLWSNGQTGFSANSFPAGSHYVLVADALGCEDSVAFVIGSSADLVAGASVQSVPTCAGAADGSAIASAGGGTASYQFVWSNGQTGPAASGLAAGTYTVVVTDANGCQDSASVVINSPSAVTFATSLLASPTCFGASDGSAQVAVSGGTPPYSIVWANGDTGTVATGLPAGWAAVAITDANGCQAVDSILLSQPSPLQLTLSAAQLSCFGGSDGSLAVSVSGGTGPYSALWSNGQTGFSANNLAAGSYSVLVTDANGCQDTASANLPAPAPVVASALQTSSVSCFGGSDGVALASASGGSGGFTFAWSNGQTDPVLSGVPAGTYTVVATDASGCADSATVQISQPADLLVQANGLTMVSCFGGNDGSAEVSLLGGTAPYQVLWSNGQTNFMATGLSAGTHTVLVTDANGCTGSATVVISQPQSLALNLAVLQGISCAGGADGQLQVVVSGGTAPFTLLWSQGDTGLVADNLVAGTYVLTVTDSKGCAVVDSISLADPGPVVVSVQLLSGISCAGGADGVLLALASGGDGNYQYLWSQGGTGPINANLAAGSYTVTVTDGLGCQDTASVFLSEPQAIQLQLTLTDSVSCFGGNDGIVVANASGGTGVLTYLWSNGQTSPVAGGLPAGPVSLVVTDANGCQDSASVAVWEPTDLALTMNLLSPPACTGASNGSAEVTVTGGQGPYSYVWSNGQTSSVATGLMAGVYTVVVTDAAGCQETAQIQLQAGAAPVVGIQVVQNISCQGQADGALAALVSGASGPLSYLWSNGDTTATISGLGAGSYTVQITDEFGCSASDTLAIQAPASLQVAVDITQTITCPAGNDGQLYAAVAGGTAPYGFLWSNGDTSQSAQNLAAGSYQVVVTDANGCTATGSEVLTDPAGLQAIIQVFDSVSCHNASDAVLKASALGGQAPYQFAWTGGIPGGTLSGLPTGTYQLTATDAQGCVDTASIFLPNPDSLSLALSVLQPLLCSDDQNGALLAQGGGGTAPVSFYWDNAGNGDTLSGIGAGTYIGVIVDVRGCSLEDTILLTAPDPLVIQPQSVQQPSCTGLSDGSIAVQVTGGTAPYSLLWSNGQTGSSLTGLAAGIYSVQVTDANGCLQIFSDTLIGSQALQATITNPVGIFCAGDSTGQLLVSVANGTGPFSFLWDDGSTQALRTTLPAGNYQVLATDSAGCVDTASFLLAAPNPLVVQISSITGVSCFGSNDGSAQASANGGVGGYSFVWSNGQAQANVSQLPAGMAWVLVTDGNGCQDSAFALISQPDSLIATISQTQPILCAGGQTAALQVQTVGGTPGYTYTWTQQGLSGAFASGLGAGAYAVTVTDANGCTDTSSLQVVAPAALTLATQVVQAISCFGDTDGEALATATGGTAPFTYLWSNGQTTALADNLPGGTYSVAVTDANGCQAVQTVTLVVPAELQATIEEDQPISCFGDADGVLKVLVQGGTTSYNYTWSNGQTGTQIANLGEGAYAVVVVDGHGCVDSANYQLTVPAELSAAIELVSPVVCAGAADAILTGQTQGGTAPFTFTWTPGGQADTLFGVGAGLVQLTIVDDRGCEAQDTLTVTEPSVLSLTGQVVQPILCFGGTNGALAVSASGGKAPYQVFWPGFGPDSVLTNLSAGTYLAVVVDALGCADSVELVLEQPVAISLGVSVLQAASCELASNGSARVSVLGGVSPFVYQWSSLEENDTAFALVGGWNYVTVVDSAGCVAQDSVFMPSVLPWSATTTVLDTVTCFGGADGSAEVLFTGTLSGYSILWDNGETTNPAVSLTEDTTWVTVTDFFGCDTTVFVVLPQPEEIRVFGTVADTDPGLANGAIRIDSVLFGTGPFGYDWLTGQSGTILTDLDSGSYAVLVTDSNGCEGLGVFEVGVNKLIWRDWELAGDCELGVVTLNWEVQEEKGVATYSIERSEDGLAFTRVAEDSSRGDTVGLRRYTLQDSLTPVLTTYYRVRATFANGNSVVSETMELAPCQTDTGFVEVYPVPVQLGDDFTAVFMLESAGEVRIELRNALHQTLKFFDIPNAVGRQVVVFDTEELAAGHYYVVVSSRTEAYSARVLVIE